jgi:hypothetical protein
MYSCRTLSSYSVMLSCYKAIMTACHELFLICRGKKFGGSAVGWLASIAL